MTTPAGRRIGTWGTAARIAVGIGLVASVGYGHATRGWHPLAWVLGLLVFPGLAVVGQWWLTRRHPAPLRAVGPLGHALNLAVFLALYLTWWYAPRLDVLSDAALLFYGGSMLVAAVRGYAGCEVLAVSNWLLRRDDVVGCAPFYAVDQMEIRHESHRVSAATVGAVAGACPSRETGC